MTTSFRRLFAVIGIGLGIMVLGMIWSIANTALASIQKDLTATMLELQWMINSFGIFICVPLLLMGKLGDSYGRKYLFLLGLIGALIASFTAGFATHIGLLIFSMGLFGLSGSVILPLSQALLVHQFPETQKEKAVGLWSIFASLSFAIGPLIGGLILNFWGWRWIYFINVPLLLISLPIVVFFVHKETKLHKSPCDWLGVILLALFVGTFITAIMQGPTWGWTSPVILTLFFVSLIVLVIFLIFERKSQFPLFRPDLFSKRSFLFSAIPNGCMIGFVWVAFFLIPLYLQNMKNYTPLHMGLTMLLVTLPVALFSNQVSKFYRKIGAQPLLISGFLFLVISALLQALFATLQEPFWPIGIGCLALGIGWVLIWGPSISCGLSSLPHHSAGIASGMFTTLQEFSAVLILSIAGSIFRMTQHHYLASSKNQIDLALEQFSSDKVDSLISNPNAVEQHLGANSPIVLWLKEAFSGGYRAGFWFLLALCIFAIFMSLFLPQTTAFKKQK